MFDVSAVDLYHFSDAHIKGEICFDSTQLPRMSNSFPMLAVIVSGGIDQMLD